MKIVQAFIHGYGRLRGREMNFSPGLQIIIGPNEKGKSTLRCFLMDMLYGQKSSLTRVLYEESNTLRMPWEQPMPSGGVLRYALDQGGWVSVERSFHPDDEWCRVRDEADSRDITESFEQYPNGEIRFAQAHLGLGKEVFAGSATIDHMHLEMLGSQDALEQIRDKLHTVADSGGAFASAEDALHQLESYLEALGRPGAPNKPLPAGRARLRDLGRELEEARALRRDVAETGEKRRKALQEAERLRLRRQVVEAELRAMDAHGRRARLTEAENILARIDAATQRCFGMGGARDFPLDRGADVQRAATRAQTARLQVERTAAELRELRRQMESEQRRAEPGWNGYGDPIPPDLEKQWDELSGARTRLMERKAELQRLLEEAETRQQNAQSALVSMPDFGQLGGDPMEWLTQLASSFQLAVRARDEECELLERIRLEVEQREAALGELRAAFQEQTDFIEKAREYELHLRMREERLRKFGDDAMFMEAVREDIVEGNPQYLLLGLVCAGGVCALGAAFFSTRNHAVLYAAGVLGASAVWFLGNYILGRRRIGTLARRMSELDSARGTTAEQRCDSAELIEALLKQTGCETVRELEAAYDQYREANAELTAHLEVFRSQEAKARESVARVAPLLSRVRETFAKVGESIEREEDVPRVAGNTVARYHAYREAKRSWSESRAALERRMNELARCDAELARIREDLAQMGEGMRQVLREYGFEEGAYADIGEAVRAYRDRVAQYSELRGRAGLMEERAAGLEKRLLEEQTDLEQSSLALELLLGQAGVSSMAQWQAMADKAREYRELWTQRGALEEQLRTLLGGQELTTLRHSVQDEADLPPVSKNSREEQLSALEELNDAIARRMDEAHVLHVSVAERSAACRPIAEIEEERAYWSAHVDALEIEFEAACHAMALIEDIARGRHACMAPVLAERASRILQRITGGTYSELRVASDLGISVRIPETRRIEAHPEKLLSKGAVDQIYFALRLAMVQVMNGAGESIPMLLDDPLANYDDDRLRETMAVLAEMGRETQILLFTCREDVVRAAQALDTPILRLE